MRARSYLLLASLTLGAVLAAPSRESRACGNEVEYRTDFRVQLVANADRNTAEGKHRQALLSLKLALPEKGDMPTGEHVVNRAFAVSALAIARSDGRYDLRGVEAGGETGTAEAMRHAVAIGKHFYDALKDDNAAKTNYGEILSHLSDRRTEAKRILGELEANDLVTSAYGYAALARMREEAGRGAPPWLAPALAALEHAPAAMAKTRCERMASYKGICSGESSERMHATASLPPGGGAVDGRQRK